jgi:5'-3' exonuclease
MGGQHFFCLHGENIRMHPQNINKGKKIAVDHAYQLHRLMRGLLLRRHENNSLHEYLDEDLIKNKFPDKDDSEIIEYEENISHIIANISFAELICDRQIFPVFVLDGTKQFREYKQKKLDNRREIREQAKIKRDTFDKTSDEYNKYNLRCVELHNRHYRDTYRLMKILGLPIVKAYGEADSQCAALTYHSVIDNMTRNNNIVGIITEDSDALIFGGSCIIKDFSRKNTSVSVLKLCDILETSKNKVNNYRRKYNLEPIDEFTEDNLIDLSILNGTDYNDPIYITGFGKNKLFELFALHNLNVESLVNYLQEQPEFYKRVHIPNNFIDSWQKVREYYTSAKVIDPIDIDTDIKLPNLNDMKNLLVGEYCFKESVVNRLYEQLVQLYEIYMHITINNSNFKSFTSYQIKFYNSKNKNKNKNKNRQHDNPFYKYNPDEIKENIYGRLSNMLNTVVFT